MRQQTTKHYKLQVTMSFEEFAKYGDAIKAHFTVESPYSLCGDIIKFPKIWVNKSNFDVFHPVFSDYTEFIGESTKFIYYGLPCIKDTISRYLYRSALSYNDTGFDIIAEDYMYKHRINK